MVKLKADQTTLVFLRARTARGPAIPRKPWTVAPLPHEGVGGWWLYSGRTS